MGGNRDPERWEPAPYCVSREGGNWHAIAYHVPVPSPHLPLISPFLFPRYLRSYFTTSDTRTALGLPGMMLLLPCEVV